ncbi:MAG: RelA/SpoT family protein [Rikenellaceae bacterium]|jgi:GTP pyrophosphokinase|nr:RelA/SpoT family protein [Rikenellaceae bacterium]
MDGFRRIVGEYFSSESAAMVLNALERATEYLNGHKRYDDRPLIEHSVATARIVITEIGLGRNSTISTLMHDAVRLGKTTATEVGQLYGAECAGIIEGLCNISEVDAKVSQEQAGNFRDLIVSYATDPRVILIKLADRLEVMRSLSMFPREKQLKKSWESINLYAGIAHKLGLYPVKSELEDISLRYLEPESYSLISTKLAESAGERERFIAEFLGPIEKRLKESNIKYSVKGRTKSIYSIWSKMRRTGLPFDDIFDIFAIRIIIYCQPEQEKSLCWGVYAAVTDLYTPNTERTRDWISIPKSNGYESLHTTVVTREGRWAEIQIRTERMDAVAERGIAAHWRYKGVRQGGMGSEEWLGVLRDLLEHGPESLDAPAIDSRLSSDEIFVFTPRGDIRKLPKGATALDFAFDIHTNLGAQCVGGRVNQRNVPIKEELHNGDIVEILTSKNQKPKLDWLNIVVTGKARNKIRTYIREEQAKAANLGREELERKIKNWKLGISVDDAVTMLCRRFKIKRGIELYGQIVEGRIDVANLKDILTNPGETPQPLPPKPRTTQTPAKEESSDALVIEEGLGGIDYKMGKCCNPIYGDRIFGFVTVNAGVTVHRADCPNAMRLQERYPYRVIDARWRSGAAGWAFRATIFVAADDIPGVVGNITETITRELKLNIRSFNLAPTERGSISGMINIEVTGKNIIDLTVYSLLKIKGVQKAYRVGHE